MLAKRRTFKINGCEIQTPMLVPSFSSRGFSDVDRIVSVTKEYISDQVLISAFDLHHKHIKKNGWEFAEILFVDSGGYEFGQDFDVSDYKREKNSVKASSDVWSVDLHNKTLATFKMNTPTVLVSFDNPNRRDKTKVQIKRAKEFFADYPKQAHNFLLKAEPKGKAKNKEGHFLSKKQIIDNIEEFKHFDIIGVTEKELGRSRMDRLQMIHFIRATLMKHEMDTPIHVFGSLDPISSTLYFLAGADIFDGLTWLRFAYHEGIAMYLSNYADLMISPDTKDAAVHFSVHNNNYNVLTNMQIDMETFAHSKEYATFKHHKKLFETCMKQLAAKVGEE